jgi:hypothetical protein
VNESTARFAHLNPGQTAHPQNALGESIALLWRHHDPAAGTLDKPGQ